MNERYEENYCERTKNDKIRKHGVDNAHQKGQRPEKRQGNEPSNEFSVHPNPPIIEYTLFFSIQSRSSISIMNIFNVLIMKKNLKGG